MRAFDDRLFHDCILEAIDLSHWKDEVTLRVLCPVRARGRDAARHRTLVFKRVLCFAFETAVIGEFGNDGPEVSIYMMLILQRERRGLIGLVRWVPHQLRIRMGFGARTTMMSIISFCILSGSRVWHAYLRKGASR